MPRHVLEDVALTLNGTVISARVKKITIRPSLPTPKKVTAMTDDYDEYVKVNVKGHKGQVEFYQDYSSGSAYSIIKTIFEASGSSGVAFIVRPTTAIRSSDNPEFQGTWLIDGEFPVLQADDVGEVNMMAVNFLGNGALIFASSSS